MNVWWSLPFAVLVVLAVWCRVAGPERLVRTVASVLGFFGVGGIPSRSAAADFFGIAGVSGLLFVGWSGQLIAPPDAWLVADAVLSSLGVGLLGAWVLARLARERDPGAGPMSREMTTIEVDELPGPTAGGGEGETSAPTRDR